MHKQHVAVIRELHSFVRKHRIYRLGGGQGRTPLVIFRADDIDRIDELAKLEIDPPLRLTRAVQMAAVARHRGVMIAWLDTPESTVTPARRRRTNRYYINLWSLAGPGPQPDICQPGFCQRDICR
jgi:hypothetical protein